MLCYSKQASSRSPPDPHIKPPAARLSQKGTRLISDLFQIYVLTADTNGTARQMCEGLPVEILTFPNDAAMQEKQNILYSLGKENCAAIGNGRNDLLMCREAAFSVSVLGQEGMYGRLMTATDLCVPSVLDALELFLKPHRIIASLRG